MGWTFEADCPDCGHHWGGCVASLHVGPTYYADQTQEFFCQQCCNCLYLPRLLERKIWQRWCEAHRATSPPWVKGLVAHIDAGFASCAWYTPHQVDPGTVNCPECGMPMVPGVPEGNHVRCPECGGLGFVLSEYTGHAQLFVDPEIGFE